MTILYNKKTDAQKILLFVCGALYYKNILRTMRTCYLNHRNHHHTYNALCPAKQRLTMTDWLTTKPRHRNERLTVFSAASNKRRRSCPGHLCFENSFLISWAWAGQRYLSSVIYWRNIGNASGHHLPSSGASSISARRTHRYYYYYYYYYY